MTLNVYVLQKGPTENDLEVTLHGEAIRLQNIAQEMAQTFSSEITFLEPPEESPDCLCFRLTNNDTCLCDLGMKSDIRHFLENYHKFSKRRTVCTEYKKTTAIVK